MSSVLRSVEGRSTWRAVVGVSLLVVMLLLIWVYYRAWYGDIVVPGLVFTLLVTIPLVLLWPLMTRVAVQQVTLIVLLISGLACYLIAGWRLLSSGAIDSAANVAELQKAGLQLFLPYLGIAIGGVFGVKRLSVTEVDLHTFFVALAVLVFWDALAIGNLWALTGALQTVASGAADSTAAVAALITDEGSTETWAFEDALHFINDLMPLLSFLPAAAIGFYFGAQPGQPAPGTGVTPADPDA